MRRNGRANTIYNKGKAAMNAIRFSKVGILRHASPERVARPPSP